MGGPMGGMNNMGGPGNMGGPMGGMNNMGGKGNMAIMDGPGGMGNMGGSGGGVEHREVPIPADLIGGVIGPGGATINELRKQAGSAVLIAIVPGSVPAAQGGQQIARISGQRHQVEGAEALVRSKLQELAEANENNPQQGQLPMGGGNAGALPFPGSTVPKIGFPPGPRGPLMSPMDPPGLQMPQQNFQGQGPTPGEGKVVRPPGGGFGSFDSSGGFSTFGGPPGLQGGMTGPAPPGMMGQGMTGSGMSGPAMMMGAVAKNSGAPPQWRPPNGGGDAGGGGFSGKGGYFPNSDNYFALDSEP